MEAIITESVIKHFWSFANAGPTEDDACWEWTGATNKRTGYGTLTITNKGWKRGPVLAHRVSYYIAIGSPTVPQGSQASCICHTCDNPRCVRPLHLFIGNAKINRQDAVSKGRITRAKLLPGGTCLYGHKLTHENTITEKDGTYCCRTCRKRNQATSYRRKCERKANQDKDKTK